MKKYYFKLKIKIIVVMILVLVVGSGILVYQKADSIRSDYLSIVRDDMDLVYNTRQYLVKGGKDLVKQVYQEYYEILGHDDIGFYSMLKDYEGNTLAETQNFIIIKKDNEEEDKRIILLGNEFPKDEEESTIKFAIGAISSMEITGTCDDTFIYLDELKWEGFTETETYTFEYNNVKSEGTIPFEEWAGSNLYDEHLHNEYTFYPFYPFVYYNHDVYGDEKQDQKLDEEAREICEVIYQELIGDINTLDSRYEDGLFTCYVANSGYIGDSYLGEKYALPFVFVFHPVNIAIDELAPLLIISTIVVIIMICIICSTINKVYKNQLAYEMNRRELTRGIAHELKTPLAITKGYVENWKYMDEKDREQCSETIIDEIEHMNAMVTDLLELSRLEAKAKEINLESVDIHSLSNSVLKRLHEMISEKGVQVTVEPEEGPFLVNADLEMMRTVLVNLITNAVKYSDKTIGINILETNKKIKFTITNDGKTIEAKKIAKIWDEFYRDDYSNDHHIGSSGLGLAITKNILILHNAKYGCSSEGGKTTFWFEMKKDLEQEK